MTTPSASELFMNVWVARINSEECPLPGDDEWNREKMQKYWGRVWMDCRELSSHLQECQKLVDSTNQMLQTGTKEPELTAEELDFLTS